MDETAHDVSIRTCTFYTKVVSKNRCRYTVYEGPSTMLYSAVLIFPSKPSRYPLHMHHQRFYPVYRIVPRLMKLFHIPQFNELTSRYFNIKSHKQQTIPSAINDI